MGRSKIRIWLIAATLLGGAGCTTYMDNTGGGVTVEGACGTAPQDGEVDSWAVQEQAGYWLNCYRNLAGQSQVPVGSSVGMAASRHAAYMDETLEFGFLEELPAAANYSGYDVLDRLDVTGFQLDLESHYLDDLITRTGSGNAAEPRAAIDAWIDTVYHRSPLLRPGVDVIGIGASGSYVNLVAVGPWDSQVDGGAGGLTAAIYPVDGQIDVPARFASDSETPDPVTDRDETGYPISVTFHGEAWHDSDNHFDLQLDPAGCSLRSQGGDQLPLLYREPDTDLHLHDSVFLIPLSALEDDQTYHVQIAVTVNGQPWERAWSFTTAEE